VFNLLAVTPVDVDPGEPVALSWDVSNAELIELLTPVQRTLPPTGLEVFRIDAPTTFTVRATNAAGQVTESVTVSVNGALPPAPAP
jgi:hypothetical protein